MFSWFLLSFLYSTSFYLFRVNGQNSNDSFIDFEIYANKSEPIVKMEFNESDIRKLNLIIDWKINKELLKNPNRFVLLMEKQRINVHTLAYEYAEPTLLDDETILNPANMAAENFVKRVELEKISAIDCALNCVNSSKHSEENETFDCNVFYYHPYLKICSLYQYDFDKPKNKKKQKIFNQQTFISEEIYDHFVFECAQNTDILSMKNFIPPDPFCKRLLDYRFSLSVRDEKNNWTPFVRSEYHYAPKIVFQVSPETPRIGKNVSVECKTDLDQSVVNSISWKISTIYFGSVLKLTPLTYLYAHQTFYCEIKYNRARVIQKAFRFTVPVFNETPKLNASYSFDTANLNLHIKLDIKMPEADDAFHPDRIMFFFFDNSTSTYKFVNKYLLFDQSKYDNRLFSNNKISSEILAKSEEECAVACLQQDFCNHFVYNNALDYSKRRKNNCFLTANSQKGLVRCDFSYTCANIGSFKRHIDNNTLSLSILPNITHKFKIRVKDRNFNWTNWLETPPINIPVFINVVEEGSTLLTNSTDQKKFSLRCNTSLSRNLSVLITWLKNDVQILNDFSFAVHSTPSDEINAGSILEFRTLSIEKFFDYQGEYKCRVFFKYVDVGQSTFYLSQPKFVKFTYNEPVRYEIVKKNVTLPTIPSLHIELSCIAYGFPMPKLKWSVDGVVYSDKSSNPLVDDYFVLNVEDEKRSQNNHILAVKINSPKNFTKHECYLENGTVIREYFIQIIDVKPLLDVEVNTAKINKQKLDFRLKWTHKNKKYFNNVNHRPLKFSILYVENSTFDSASKILIAPNTLSSESSIDDYDEGSKGTLKDPTNEINSCKIACFTTPMCHIYEYQILESSCAFFSSNKLEKIYFNITETFKNEYDSSFNLIHVSADHMPIYEDPAYSNKIIIENKHASDCSLSSWHATDAELPYPVDSCTYELNEFNEVYSIDNLLPGTSYQFKIEIGNAFGISEPFITELIDVTLPLNPIEEKEEKRNNSVIYYLLCSAPISGEYFRFYWYANNERILDTNTDYAIINEVEMNGTETSRTSSRLEFKDSASLQPTLYDCSLVFDDQKGYTYSRNESHVYFPKFGPTYELYEWTMENKTEGESWYSECSARGWPLPKLDWYFNGALVQAKHNSVDLLDISNSQILVHHTNINITAYLFVNNLTPNKTGIYSCVVNGKFYIKNVTVSVSEKTRKIINVKTTTVEPELRLVSYGLVNNATPPSHTTNFQSIFLPIFLSALIVSFAAISVIYYYKRRNSGLSTSLSYNRIEEELITGVDNPSINEENNLESFQT